jgi:hypothetical protein
MRKCSVEGMAFERDLAWLIYLAVGMLEKAPSGGNNLNKGKSRENIQVFLFVLGAAVVKSVKGNNNRKDCKGSLG